jgi:hypothetical protein
MIAQPKSLIRRNLAFSDIQLRSRSLFLALFKPFSFALSFFDARANRKYSMKIKNP